MPTKLTKRVVESAKTETKDAFLWDTEIAGFGVKVTAAGGKVYILQARLEGRKRRFTIGRHGSPWTVDEARKEAVRLLATVYETRKDLVSARRCLERVISLDHRYALPERQADATRLEKLTHPG